MANVSADATTDHDPSHHLDDIVIDAGVAIDDHAEDITVPGFTEAAVAFVRTFPHAPIVLVLTTVCMLFVIFDHAPALSEHISIVGTQRLHSQQLIIASLLKILNVTSENAPSGLETISVMRLNQEYLSANYGVGGWPQFHELVRAFEQHSTDKHAWAMSILGSGSQFLQVADKNVKILEQKASNHHVMLVYIIISLCSMEVVAICALAWATPRRNWLDKIEAARALDMAKTCLAKSESRAKAYQSITGTLSHDLRGVSSNGMINLDLLRNVLDESRSPEGSCIITDPVTNELIDTLTTSIVSDNTHVQYAVRSVQMISSIINENEHHVPANEEFNLTHLTAHLTTMYPTVRLEEITTLSNVFRGDEVAIPLPQPLPQILTPNPPLTLPPPYVRWQPTTFFTTLLETL